MKRSHTNEQIIEAVSKVKSYAGVCRELGLSPKGGNINTIKKYIELLNIDTAHFTGQNWNKGLTEQNHPSIKNKPIEQILIENSGWTSTAIKNRLFKTGLKERKCECCNIIEWLDQPAPLELHHINGINNDNRIENLQILCPNCHSQTENFSRNNARVG